MCQFFGSRQSTSCGNSYSSGRIGARSSPSRTARAFISSAAEHAGRRALGLRGDLREEAFRLRDQAAAKLPDDAVGVVHVGDDVYFIEQHAGGLLAGDDTRVERLHFQERAGRPVRDALDVLLDVALRRVAPDRLRPCRWLAGYAMSVTSSVGAISISSACGRRAISTAVSMTAAPLVVLLFFFGTSSKNSRM